MKPDSCELVPPTPLPSTLVPVSVVIAALNEERRVGDCLDSVRPFTDDVVVVDAGSRDRTRQICDAKAARVFRRSWTGFSDQKNFGNAQARHDWILSLDADERVTPELVASIRHEFGGDQARHDAYTIRFQNLYIDRKIRFGAWNPEWHRRLFDRRKFVWNAVEVHEGLSGVKGCTTGRLDGCIRHLAANSRTDLVRKTEQYSQLFALKMLRTGKVPGWTKVWLNPAWRFARDYFLKLGILDGTAGWIIAWEAAHYTHLKYRRALPKDPTRLPVECFKPAQARALWDRPVEFSNRRK